MLAFFQDGMVFGVLQHHFERNRFHVGQNFPELIFLPGIKEKLPNFDSGRVKHAGSEQDQYFLENFSA